MARRVFCALALLALVFSLCSCAPAAPAANVIDENALVAHFIDVGQGDSTLILCGGMTMLVDAGTDKSAEKLVAFIRAQGVKRLDYIVATHPHADHIGGMKLVLESFEVGTFLMPDAIHTTATFEQMLDAISENGCSAEYISDGYEFELGRASVRALSPAEGEKYADLNNYSAVLSIKHGTVSLLMTGDAEKEIEQSIASSLEPHDILKVGHHGSQTSSSADFLAAVNPRYAVIFCGAGNEYGHPHAEVLDRLSGVDVLRTDLDGTVTVTVDGGKIDVQTEKNIRP